jgi:MFS family permease
LNDEKRNWPAFTLITLTGINLFNYLDRQVLSAVLTPIKEEFGLTDGQLGSLATAFMLGYFLTAPIFGYLGDKFPRKWLIAMGVIVWSLGTLLTGVAHGFWSLVAFRVLVGLGEASYGTISPGWIADLYPPARRNNALSIFYAAIPVGSALGYIAGGVIATHYGWRAAFWAAGLAGFVFVLGLAVLKEPARGAVDAPGNAETMAESKGWLGYLDLFKRPLYVLLVLGYIGQTFTLGGFAIWAPTFLYRIHGMSVEKAAWFFGLSLVVTGLIATLLGGWISTQWRKKNPAAYAWVLGGSMLLGAPAAFAAFSLSDPFWAKAMLVASMFLLFLSTGPVNTLILETVPVRSRAAAMAASIFCIHLFGDLPSPWMVGELSDRVGIAKAVLLLPCALVFGAVFWLWLAVRMQRSAKTA